MQRDLKRKKLCRKNQGSNFLGGSFYCRGTLRTLIGSQCLLGQIQIQKPTIVLATNKTPDQLRVESSIAGIDTNITSKIIRKAINV